MRDLHIRFADGTIKPLLELSDIEFNLVLFYAGANCLVLTDVSPSCNPIGRIELEKFIRNRRK